MIGILLFLQLSLAADSLTFADALIREGDYFRAISEYKRVLFYSDNDSIKNYCLLQIAKSYRKSNKFESAINYSSLLLNKNNLSTTARSKAELTIGLGYLENNLPQISIDYFNKSFNTDSNTFSLLCLGLAELKMRNWKSALITFSKSINFCRDTVLRSQVIDFQRQIEDIKTQSKKSPIVSSTLSLVIPGSGQIYSGHTYDGIQAFLYTASAAFASYAIYKYEKSFKGHLELTYISISVTAIFHAANILGAYQTANYYNLKQENDLIRNIRNTIIDNEPQ